MSHNQIVIFSIILVLLIILSGFFSAAETGLMAVNRYRLRHKARMKKRSAIMILRLLKRPDRLLGMILIGNSFANILASALATLLATHFWGERGVILSTLLLTFVVLIFSEVAPKTVAALYPEAISKWVRWPVFILLKIFYPFVVLINVIANNLLRLFGIRLNQTGMEPFSRDELRSIVFETSGRQSQQYQAMLLGILDLNKVLVTDVMVPRHEVVGVDLQADWATIQGVLSTSSYDWLPVYQDDINQVVGMLHMRELMHFSLGQPTLNKELIQQVMHEPYFIPEGTTLNVQLLNFQRQHKRTALIVDEYGEVQGLLTLADILEEIVGEFTTSGMPSIEKVIQKQSDGSYLVEGSVELRELNRVTGWQFTLGTARTLSGLIIEFLQTMPRPGTCVKINEHPIEILRIDENRVTMAKVFPQLVVREEEVF